MELKKSKILLITSNLFYGNTLSSFLQILDGDFELFITGNAYFKSYIDRHDIDLIIIDYSSSKEILLALLNDSFIKSNEVPIILIISREDYHKIDEIISLGISDYVVSDRLERLKIAILRDLNSYKIKKEFKQLDLSLSKTKTFINNLTYSNNDIINDAALIFFRLFHSIPIGISLVRVKDNIILDINDSYLELLELNREDILGKKALDLNLWKFPRERERIINFITKYGSIKNQEVTLLTQSGREKSVLISAIYLPKDEATEAMMLFMSLDITDRKKMEEEIIHAYEKEKELSVLKTRFISMISHEFRTPLTTIMLSTDILRNYGQDWSKEEKETHYSRIRSTVLSLIQLLENVLIIGKIDSGNYDFNPEDIDIPSFIEATVEYALSNANSQNKIITKIEGDPKNILVDENVLSLVLNNLLSNALKYSKDNTNIELKVVVSRFEHKLIFIVKDYGIGISEEDLPNIFDSFYRGSNVGNIPGFGLGLNIVKKCVDQIYGRVSVESKINEFTQVTVTLPLLEYKNSI